MLVGNKCDEIEREVSFEEGRRLAEEIGAGFVETSAKNGKNVDMAFRNLSEQIVKGIENENGKEKR